MKKYYLGLIMTEDHENIVNVVIYENKYDRNTGWKAIDATWCINNPYNFYMWFVDVTIDDKRVTSIIEYTALEPVAYVAIKEALSKLGIR